MKNITLLISILYLVPLHSMAQSNNIKLNLSNAVFGDIRLGYEIVTNEKQTLQINAGMLVPRRIPYDVIDETAIKEYDASVDILKKISGFNISAEYRFYTSGRKKAPFGFYVAPYLKYNSYSLKVTQYFEYKITPSEYDSLTTSQQESAIYLPSYDMYDVEAIGVFKGNFNQAGGGIMIGWQWQLGSNITIDLNLLGLGIESDIVVLDLTAEDADIDYQKWGSDIESKVKEYIFIGDKVDVIVESDRVKIRTDRFLLPTFRSSLSIGFAF